MSEPHALSAPVAQRNPARSEAGAPLARAVHGWRLLVSSTLVMASTSLLVGCVIPPSLEVGADAGVNSPPAILAVTSDQQALPEPGPVLFEQGPTAGSVSVSLIDADVADILNVRIFVDYNAPARLDARVRCPPSATGTALRSVTCNLTNLCTVNDLNALHDMTIVVFDRPVLEDGTEPAFQAMDAPGLSTSRFYFLKCVPGQS
jgi:hypothetical protein